MKIKIINEKYHSKINTARERTCHDENIRKALKTHGNEVKKELVTVLTTGSRTGRVYSYRGSKHIASAPGEAPASRSGKLAKGFRYKSSHNQLTVGNVVFSREGAPYSLFLEEGTRKMKPRPFFQNTIVSLQYRLQKDLQKL